MKSLSCSLVLGFLMMDGAGANAIRVGGGHKRTSHHIGERYTKPSDKNNMVPMDIVNANLDPISSDFAYFGRF